MFNNIITVQEGKVLFQRNTCGDDVGELPTAISSGAGLITQYR